jgi:hypothetical protein
MKIKNFVYDGIGGKSLPGNAPYTVEFISWTDDPGMFLGKCSDGKERLIPAWAAICHVFNPPMPDYVEVRRYIKENNLLIHMGTPSSSD